MPRAKKATVGIVGLGIMGGAFAQNLIAAGWPAIGYDIARSRRRAMAKLGVDIAESAEDVARQARTVITSLPKPSALVETAAAIAKAGLPRRVIVEMSTFALEDKIKAEAVLRKAGHVMLDCPISGTGAQAVVKDLVVYASGDSREIRKLRGLFSDFTRALTNAEVPWSIETSPRKSRGPAVARICSVPSRVSNASISPCNATVSGISRWPAFKT